LFPLFSAINQAYPCFFPSLILICPFAPERKNPAFLDSCFFFSPLRASPPSFLGENREQVIRRFYPVLFFFHQRPVPFPVKVLPPCQFALPLFFSLRPLRHSPLRNTLFSSHCHIFLFSPPIDQHAPSVRRKGTFTVITHFLFFLFRTLCFWTIFLLA